MYQKLLSYQTYTRRAVALCAASIALCAFSYGAFLLLAVERTASRATLQTHITVLTEQVAQYQTQYLSETQALTPERAQAMGFTAPAQVAVVYSNPHGLSLRSTQ